LKLPGELVWVHVALATLTWLAMLWSVAAAGRLEPREGVPTHRAGATDQRSAPALTQI
jgi:hypothetical protein